MNKVSRILHSRTYAFRFASEDNFPKYVPSTNQIVVNLAEQEQLEIGPFELIMGPITVIDEELGRDFESCVLIEKNDKTVVLRKEIPKPVLTSTQADGITELRWTSAFEIPTFIYRTPVYETGTEAPAFELIAKINGTNVPGGPVTYLDDTIKLEDDLETVEYYVINVNGKSNTIIETGEPI